MSGRYQDGSMHTDWCHMTQNLGSVDTDPVECRVREDVAIFPSEWNHKHEAADLHVVPRKIDISAEAKAKLHRITPTMITSE